MHRIQISKLSRDVNWTQLYLSDALARLSEWVAKGLTISSFPGCHAFPAKGWANNCLIGCKLRVQEHGGTMPIHPCIALGLFLANCAMDMNDTLCPNDPTIQYLSYALQRYQGQSDDQHTSDTLTQ
ncbi:hypothetical protein G6F43_008157 [Rhizopus delemar]|nr:hypothetical protein G6F43_008157 [Rhizopus delemar]